MQRLRMCIGNTQQLMHRYMTTEDNIKMTTEDNIKGQSYEVLVIVDETSHQFVCGVETPDSVAHLLLAMNNQNLVAYHVIQGSQNTKIELHNDPLHLVCFTLDGWTKYLKIMVAK